MTSRWGALPVELGHPHRFAPHGQRGVPALGRPQQPGHLGGIGDRDIQRSSGGAVGVAHRQGMKAQHVEVGRLRAGATSLQAQERAQERDGRHAPHPGRVAVGCDARGYDEVVAVDRLDARIEGVQELTVDQRRVRAPAPLARDPLGLQVAREVGLVPCLVEPYPGQRTLRIQGICKRTAVAARERNRKRLQSRRVWRPAAGVGITPPSRRLCEGRGVGDDEQRGQTGAHRTAQGGVELGEFVHRTRRVCRVEAGGPIRVAARSPRCYGPCAHLHEAGPVDRYAHDGRTGGTGVRQRERTHLRIVALK